MAALVVSAPLRPPARLLPMILAVGAFDTLANVFVAFATTCGPAGIVAVLSALYPVTTVLLARVVLGERLDRERRIGARSRSAAPRPSRSGDAPAQAERMQKQYAHWRLKRV